MKFFTTTTMACALLFLAGCGEKIDKADKNPFVGQWKVSVQCLDHESEPGHEGADEAHLDGSYGIAARGDKFYLQPESGMFKDEFSNCELDFNRAQGKTPDGKDFSCQSFNPGAGAMRLSGTCDLTHSGRPTPHSVQVYLIDNSPLYQGGKNPVIQFSHPGPAHAGWLH